MSRPAVRRSRADVRFGRFLRPGQEWRRVADGTVWRVRQIHHMDCLARLEREGQQRVYVEFAELRIAWRYIAWPTTSADAGTAA